MIVNVRGTGGAGKSTLVRRVMACCEVKTPHFVEGRKRPVGYLCSGFKDLWVPGHYETACGGCDTYKTVDSVYESVRAQTCDVLFEGIMVGDDVKRFVALPNPKAVVFLDPPLEVCLDSIRARREERGDDRPLNSTNTANRLHSLKRIVTRLRDAGVLVYRETDREGALNRVLGLLGLQPTRVS